MLAGDVVGVKPLEAWHVVEHVGGIVTQQTYWGGTWLGVLQSQHSQTGQWGQEGQLLLHNTITWCWCLRGTRLKTLNWSMHNPDWHSTPLMVLMLYICEEGISLMDYINIIDWWDDWISTCLLVGGFLWGFRVDHRGPTVPSPKLKPYLTFCILYVVRIW